MAITERSIELATLAANTALEKKAKDILAIDVSEKVFLADIYLLLSVDNDRQARAVADLIDEVLSLEHESAVHTEGKTEAHWILLDYGSITIHIFQTEDREHYSLERLLGDCPVVPIETTLNVGV